MAKRKSDYIQLTIEDFIGGIKTKPTYIEGVYKIYVENDLLELLKELEEETFTIGYENEKIRFALPIRLGEIIHYLSGMYETDFSIATGKNDICRTESIYFAGGGEMLRKVIVEGEKLSFVSDTIDWGSQIRVPHTARNWSQIHISDKGDEKRSVVTLNRESYGTFTKTLPKNKKMLSDYNIADYLKGQFVTIEVDNIRDDIVKKITTIPLEIKDITTKGDTFKIHSVGNSFLELKEFNELKVNPQSITAIINSDNTNKCYVHLK